MGLLGVTITDDLDIALDPDTYQDQTAPAPPVAGNYNFRIMKLDSRKTKTGEQVYRDGKWPLYVLEQVEIVEPEEAQRIVMLYQDLSTKPFDRQGAPAFEVGDLIRAVDASRPLRGLSQIDDALQEFADTKATFRARLDWVAYDSAYAKDELAKIGLGDTLYADMDDEEKKKANAVYKKAKIQGMKKFKKLPNGSHAPLWESPSGEIIEARAKLMQFYPSMEQVRFAQQLQQAA